MFHRDYFLKMTQELAKILARIMGLKDAGDLHKASEVVHHAYKDLFELNRDYFLNLNNSSLIEKLKVDKQLKNEQLEILAKLFFEDAELSAEEMKNNLYAKSLLILEYLNMDQKMFSFEREELISRIKLALD